MFERFTEDVRKAVLEAAEETATRRGDAGIGTEHLLIGVATVGHPALDWFGLTVDGVASALDHLDMRALEAAGIEATMDDVISTRPVRRGRWRRRGSRHLPFTRGAKQALQRSLQICLAEGHKTIRPGHLLAGLALAGHKDPAVRLLRAVGVEPADLDAAIRAEWRAA